MNRPLVWSLGCEVVLSVPYDTTNIWGRWSIKCCRRYWRVGANIQHTEIPSVQIGKANPQRRSRRCVLTWKYSSKRYGFSVLSQVMDHRSMNLSNILIDCNHRLDSKSLIEVSMIIFNKPHYIFGLMQQIFIWKNNVWSWLVVQNVITWKILKLYHLAVFFTVFIVSRTFLIY